MREYAAYLRSQLEDTYELEQADKVMEEIGRLENLIRENYARENSV